MPFDHLTMRRPTRWFCFLASCFVCGAIVAVSVSGGDTLDDDGSHGVPVPVDRVLAGDDATTRAWLENMVWHHGFTPSELRAATGWSDGQLDEALHRFDIRSDNKPKRPENAPLLVVPYPGGRHPRIGFLDGAVRPQRETKLSVFTPWDPTSYVVADIPEAIWSNLGLTYLAHTHIDTIWDEQGVALKQLEWMRTPEGGWMCRRMLPNGIEFGTRAVPTPSEVHMEMWLTNGTEQALSDLRVQNCVMLKGAKGFAAQSNDNKQFIAPYAVCRAEDGNRWVISAWVPNDRSWGNEQCPCLHSDPKFPDCPPGETRRLRGWLSFYEGDDIQEELKRITATGWQVSK